MPSLTPCVSIVVVVILACSIVTCWVSWRHSFEAFFDDAMNNTFPPSQNVTQTTAGAGILERLFTFLTVPIPLNETRIIPPTESPDVDPQGDPDAPRRLSHTYRDQDVPYVPTAPPPPVTDGSASTGWQALSDHALSERDLSGPTAMHLSPFPPPISLEGVGGDVGTSIATNTAVGSILPKFYFTEASPYPRNQ